MRSYLAENINSSMIEKPGSAVMTALVYDASCAPLQILSAPPLTPVYAVAL